MKPKNYLIFGIIGIFVFVGTVLILTNISNKGVGNLNKKWIEISIFGQCNQEPWGNDDNIKLFFDGYSVPIYDVEIRSRGTVCDACGCPRYEIKEVLIDSTNKRRVLKILNGYEGVMKE